MPTTECPGCDGTGTCTECNDDGMTCPTCDNTGDCPECDGTGETEED